MQQSNDTEQRLTDLEIKASFSEDLLDQLNQIIVRQQQQIDLLLRNLGQLQSTLGQGVSVARQPGDELPPHY